MPNSLPQFLNLSAGKKIAYIEDAGSDDAACGVMWLSGFNSDMTAIKASHLAQWAGEQNLACVRFDYSGHGASSGRFEDGTIGDWANEASVIFNDITKGPQILVGSSMGGWISLLVTLAHIRDVGPENSRIKGLVLLAPAVDMTEDLMWQRFPQDIRDELAQTGMFLRPSAYGDGPYPITLKLIEEARAHLLFAGPKINTYCPIHILHGRQDVDVPWQHSEKLIAHLVGDDVTLELIDDGNHRLSRDEDIEKLIARVSSMALA